MKRQTTALMALALASTGFSQAVAQTDYSKVEVKTTHLGEGVYMLEGAGGNIGLSVGQDGAFVIDDQYAPLSSKIMAAIKAVTDEDVAFVLNTHYHGDHTGGNEAFGKAGAHIVAHDNVRVRLEDKLKEDGSGSQDGLPVITFSHSMSFFWNDRDIRVVHPEKAHTDGDAIIFFSDANIVHMGDVFFNGWYPYIDVDGGGSLDGYIAAHEMALAQMNDETKIIPGHGPLATKADLQNTVNMLKDVRSRVQALIDDGLSEDAVVAARPLADLDEEWSWRFINGERMTRSAYRSLAGH